MKAILIRSPVRRGRLTIYLYMNAMIESLPYSSMCTVSGVSDDAISLYKWHTTGQYSL